MAEQESRKHHYVPEFLMKPWVVDGTLSGYWWDERKQGLSCKRRGPRAFCNELDLLLLERHPEGRDILENKFFGEVDTQGARCCDRLLNEGPSALSEHERCNFARLMLSLEVRAPQTVDKIRSGATEAVDSIDRDSEVREVMEDEGVSDPASILYAQQLGHTPTDRLFSNVIQGLVDNPRIGGKLINARWELLRLGERDGTFVLSDRPVVRLPEHGVWFLPLEPRTAVAVLPPPNSIDHVPGRRIAKRLNVISAQQARRFVFSVEEQHEHWLKRHLAPGSSAASDTRKRMNELNLGLPSHDKSG